MARTERNTEVTQHLVTDSDTPGLATMADAWNELERINVEVSENAIAVARQVRYDGALTVGALEDEIRFYQRRTVESVLELGKRLLVLKELTLHGEFTQRVQMLGIDEALARKFMRATVKFTKQETFPVLKLGSQSKLLELLVLDDGEIEALESGETVRGVTLDKIETMSVSELKKALRDAEADKAAKDRVIADKSEQLNRQSEQLVRRAHVNWPEAFEGYLRQLAITRKNLKHALGSLDVIRSDAMAIEAGSEAEEASLNQAREILATELVGLHNECAEMVAALGMSFDKTLGAYSDARINLLQI
jgi:hypothetical protein